MVGRCTGGCGNTVRQGISLHRLPVAPALQRLWVSSVKTTRKDGNATTQRSLVCSAHFKEDAFDPSQDLKVSLGLTPQNVRFVRHLLPTEVPTVFTRHLAPAMATPKASSSKSREAYNKRQHKRVREYRATASILKSMTGRRDRF